MGGRLEVLDGGSFTTAGDLDNAGTIDLAPGTLTVEGSYTQENSGEFDSRFGGPAAGSQFGRLDVTGQATLDGILGTSLIDGYAPPQGASCPIITFASVAGEFSALFGLAFEDGSGFTPIFNPGISPTELDLAVVPEPAGTNTTVQSSKNPSHYSDVVTLTADVSAVGSTSLVLNGTVTFYDGGTAIDTEKLVDGAASFATSVLMGGQHSIIVQYNGDSNFSNSNSTVLTQVVNRVASTTALASSLNPSIGGRSVTFTATLSPVAPAHGTPGGTVTFYDGTTAIDTETLAEGTASYSTSLLAGGSHAISVVYSGDSNFTGSQSPVINQTVIPEVIIWTNAGGGDWDSASNWVNAANPTDHHVPTDYDRAQINISGITVTHDENTADSVNSLTIASGTTLSLSSGSVAIATDSTDSTATWTMTGGTLSLAAGLTISGQTDWTGGTLNGGGTITTQGSLTLGDPNQYDIEQLDGATLVNQDAATIATLDGSYYGLFLYNGATFDNQSGASFTFLTNARIYSDGTGSTFENDGLLTQAAAATDASGIYAIFNQSATGSTEVQGSGLVFENGGTITGPMTADSGAYLQFDGGTFNLDRSSTISGAGTVYFTGATVNEAGLYAAGAGTVITGGTLHLATGPSFTFATLSMSGGTLTGFSSLTVTGSTDWTGGTITGGGTFTTQGSLTLGDPNQYDIEQLDGATLVNPGAATIATVNSSYYGLFLYNGATFDNQSGAQLHVLTNAENLFRTAPARPSRTTVC